MLEIIGLLFLLMLVPIHGRTACSSLLYVCVVIVTVGSLVMRHPGEMSTPTQGSILFGTVNGAIGNSIVHTVPLIIIRFFII